MWSIDILKSYMSNLIIKRPQTNLFRQPFLLIIDSYGPHIKLADTRHYEKYNIFIEIIQPKMTCLLQPLDLVVKKMFQES